MVIGIAFSSREFNFGGGSEPIAPADKIVVHGRVYTVNEKQPWAEALAIRGERDRRGRN